MRKVLIVGVTSGYGTLLARRLERTWDVVGVDRRPKPPTLAHLTFHRADPRSRGFENVLRRERPETVVHLGLVRHFRGKETQRYDTNVRGTRRLLDHCHSQGVRNVVLLSTSYVYGAMAENPYFMDEEHPLSASRNYPEIRDLVEVDSVATAFMWKHPELRTAILRPVPTLGRYIENSMGSYLRMRRIIVMLGFNPMMQFMHEDDLIDALTLAVEHALRGVFNVTGPGEVPLRTAVRESGGRALPLPEPIARPLIHRLFRLGAFPFPAGSIDYIKYPCTIAGRRFVEETGFRPLFSLREAFRSIRS